MGGYVTHSLQVGYGCWWWCCDGRVVSAGQRQAAQVQALVQRSRLLAGPAANLRAKLTDNNRFRPMALIRPLIPAGVK